MTTSADLTEQTLQIYDAEFETFIARWGKGPFRPPPLLLELIQKLQPGSRILDLGCGLAQDTRFLGRKGFQAVGLDLSVRLLDWARKKSAGTPLIRADIRMLPIRMNSFDTIWAAAVLVHLTKSDVGTLLKALRLTMRADARFGGTFTFGTRNGLLKGNWLPGRFFSRWQKEELAQTVRGAGFEIENLRVVLNQERKGRWLNLIARKKDR